MRDYTNFERCNGEPCCVFAERICADNYKELLEKGKDSNGEEVFGEMLDDLLYLAELIDFMGIGRCGDHQIFPFYETGQPGVTGTA